MHQGPTTKKSAAQIHRERKVIERENVKMRIDILQQEIQNLTSECAAELEINTELQAKRDFLRQFLSNSFATLETENASITHTENNLFEKTIIDEKSNSINSKQTLG